MPYLIGNAVTISTTITTGTPPVATDPSTITLTVTKPDSTVDTFTAGQLTHGGTGIYSYVYLPLTAGSYRYVWTTTVPTSASDGDFTVASSTTGLVSLADAHAMLSIPATDTSKDTVIQEFIEAATELIEQQTGPIASRPVTETFDGGGPDLVLNYFPLISVDSVTEYADGTANTLAEVLAPYAGDTYGYRTDLTIGRIVRWSGSCLSTFAPGWQNIAVTYHAGRASTPPAVFEGALLLVQHMWETQQSGRTGGKTQMRGNAAQLANYTLPYRVLEAIRPYMRPPRIA